jgi:hypothetical protein
VHPPESLSESSTCESHTDNDDDHGLIRSAESDAEPEPGIMLQHERLVVFVYSFHGTCVNDSESKSAGPVFSFVTDIKHLVSHAVFCVVGSRRL